MLVKILQVRQCDEDDNDDDGDDDDDCDSDDDNNDRMQSWFVVVFVLLAVDGKQNYTISGQKLNMDF